LAVPGAVVEGEPVDGAAVDGVVVVDPELCAEATLTPTRAKVPAVTVAMATLRIALPRRRGFDGPEGGGGGGGPGGGGAMLQFGTSLPWVEP